MSHNMSIRAVQATIATTTQEYVTPADEDPGSLNGDEPPSIEEEPPHVTPVTKPAAPTRTPRPAIWSHIPDEQWDDWHWQLAHRLNSVEELSQFIHLTDEELQGLTAEDKFRVDVTPYFASLIDPDDPHCPVRRQVIPLGRELEAFEGMMEDSLAEDAHSPVPGLVHRYPDRVLMLITTQCASYCRYCTRSRLVSNASGYDFHPEYDKQIAYIAAHPEIRDVLLSGGDPLLLSDEKLEDLLTRLRAIPHVEFLRIGTRIPVFLPQRITPELCAMLKQFHPLFISIHSNHPRELTTEVREALGRLADAGIPLGNQSVLLKHVNDDADVMKAQIQKLLMCRVKPYYVYQCDLIAGSAHLRTSVRKGLEIMKALRGHTTGYAVPQYVIDAPGGGGKVPINPDYILQRNASRVVIRNFEGKVFEYPEARDGTPLFKPSEDFHAPEMV